MLDLVPYPECSIETLCPTPWLLIQGDANNTYLPDFIMELYGRALEPKEKMVPL